MPKTALFLDGAYIEKVLEIHHNGVRIDFKKLAGVLTTDSELLRAYYYHCPPYRSPDPTPDESSRFSSKMGFFNALGHIPRFQVRLGRLAYRGVDHKGRKLFVQKSVDVLLAVDMVQLAATRAVDRIVLMAADCDFEPAIQAVKSHGVLTTLCHGPINAVDQLWEACDERIELTQKMVNQLQRKNRRG